LIRNPFQGSLGDSTLLALLFVGSYVPYWSSRVVVEALSTHGEFFCRIEKAAMSWFVRQRQVDVRRTSVTSLDWRQCWPRKDWREY